VISRPKRLAGALLLLAATAGAETLAEKTLREIVAEQKAVFARAEAAGEDLNEAQFRAEAQQIALRYDVLLQGSPDFAAAYVAYAQLLGRVGMAKEAVALLLKANKLDDKIPLVKNQMAKHLAEDGKPLEALPWLLAATDLAPNEPLYHHHLGTLLHEARDDFLLSGQFNRPALDAAMRGAFRRAAELAPDNFGYAYRAAEAHYDLENPDWDAALRDWAALEERARPGVEKETIRLHAANVLLKKGDRTRAAAMLALVAEPVLAKQRQTLLDQLAAAPAK
jgi:tetratricopeptide (TPR) repeat protein